MEFEFPSGHRGRVVRVADSPTLSVVVTSEGERADLEAGLEVLLGSSAGMEVQIVVVRAGSSAEVAELRRVHPAVHFAEAPPGTSVTELRIVGMRVAEGDVVMFGEDNRISAEWLTPRVLAAN